MLRRGSAKPRVMASLNVIFWAKQALKQPKTVQKAVHESRFGTTWLDAVDPNDGAIGVCEDLREVIQRELRGAVDSGVHRA